MSTSDYQIQREWKKPDELIKLQRLQLKKKQLAARLNQNNNNNKISLKETDREKLLEAKIAQKRKNPFAKNVENESKKTKCVPDIQEDSLLDFINTPPPPPADVFVKETPTKPIPAKLVLKPFDAEAFAKLLHKSSGVDVDLSGELENQKYTKHLPMDWSLKTRVRFFASSELPSTQLKTSQMASGLTSFVRCIDQQKVESGLDISPATRFNQATYYWQHPHLPWLTLFPRNSKENSGLTIGDRERKALQEDWDSSFKGLFHLLRARQCPYFYFCANTFTVLFRAAGIGGRPEVHALMSPSTRGLRSSLKQEGIEFSMPLKKDFNLNKSADGSLTEESISQQLNGDTEKSNSNDGEPNDKDSSKHNEEKSEADDKNKANDDDDDDDEEEEEWLQSLGVDEKEIKKMKSSHARKKAALEMAEDFSDNSLLLIEGVECQGFFSFLLNAKSSISSVGRLAGVPPTLLAPVAFPRATMQQLTMKSKKVRMDGVDYCSIEAKGIILPTFLPYVCEFLGETKNTFSATLATSTITMAFSKASQKLLEEPVQTDTNQSDDEDTAGQVFGQENLSDCGLMPGVIESICRTGHYAVSLLERICYDKDHGYAWS